MNQNNELIIENYSFGEQPIVLGKGSFGKVFLVKQVDTGEQYALKIIDKLTIENEQQEEFFEYISSEINALYSIDNPNVISIIDCLEQEESIFIITEYCDRGDLKNYIKKFHSQREALSEEETVLIAAQLLMGIRAIHQCNIIHRDLKPENILIKSSENIVKIADFGLCKTLQFDAKAKTICGTDEYMAPELHLNQSYDWQADLWSLGCIIFFLLYGIDPFPSCLNFPKLFRDLCNPQFDIDKTIQSYEKKFNKQNIKNRNPEISEDIVDLLQKMLVIDPKKRILFEEVYQHKVFEKYYNVKILGTFVNSINTSVYYYQNKQNLSQLAIQDQANRQSILNKGSKIDYIDLKQSIHQKQKLSIIKKQKTRTSINSNIIKNNINQQESYRNSIIINNNNIQQQNMIKNQQKQQQSQQNQQDYKIQQKDTQNYFQAPQQIQQNYGKQQQQISQQQFQKQEVSENQLQNIQQYSIEKKRLFSFNDIKEGEPSLGSKQNSDKYDIQKNKQASQQFKDNSIKINSKIFDEKEEQKEQQRIIQNQESLQQMINNSKMKIRNSLQELKSDQFPQLIQMYKYLIEQYYYLEEQILYFNHFLSEQKDKIILNFVISKACWILFKELLSDIQQQNNQFKSELFSEFVNSSIYQVLGQIIFKDIERLESLINNILSNAKSAFKQSQFSKEKEVEELFNNLYMNFNKFKLGYRSVIIYYFNQVVNISTDLYQSNKFKGLDMYRLCLRLMICHLIKRIFQSENIDKYLPNYKKYLSKLQQQQQQLSQSQIVDFVQFNSWISQIKREELQESIDVLIKSFQ